MKIGFVTDTNILGKEKGQWYDCKSVLDGTDIFIEYIESLSKTDEKKELVYFMPEMVIEELFAQKKAVFEEKYSCLESKILELNYALIGDIPKNNIDEIIRKEKEEYMQKFNVISLQYTPEILKELINDAICKNAPFDKSFEGKKTDAGFKDAVIWKTILFSEDINNCEKLYFFSGDKVFFENKETLERKFAEKYPKTKLEIIFFEPDGNQRQKSLQKIISDNNLLETNVVKLYNKSLLLSIIQSLRYNYTEDVIYSNNDKLVKLDTIKFNEFSSDDFVIDDINDKNSIYEVILSFKTNKYLLDDLNIETETMLLGKIKLNIILKNEKFELENFELIDIEFNMNYFSKLIAALTKSITSIYTDEFKESMEKLKKSIEINIEPIKKSGVFEQIENLNKQLPTYDYVNMLESIKPNMQFEELKTAIEAANRSTNVLSSIKKIESINENLKKEDKK